MVVMPAGKENVRGLDSPSTQPAVASDSRAITISSPNASIPIAAPNGAIVGTLSIVGTTSALTLVKNAEVRGPLGTVTLSMNPANLILCGSFKTPISLCPCVPTVGGGQPKSWEYRVYFAFDGPTLRAAIG